MTEKTEIYTRRTVDESIRRMRIAIVDSTTTVGSRMPALRETTEEFQTEMLDHVAKFETRVQDEIKDRQNEILSVESLYKSVAPDNQDDVPVMLKLFKLINDYGRHLYEALKNYDDEGIRETEMTLFQPLIYEVDYLEPVSNNFRDVITALKVAIFSHNARPYKKEQIVSLIKVIERLKKNVGVDDKAIDEILDILETHFNIAGPFEVVDLSG